MSSQTIEAHRSAWAEDMRREDGALKQPGRLREVPEEVEGVRQVELLDGVQVRDEAVAPGHARVTGGLPGARQQEVCI